MHKGQVGDRGLVWTLPVEEDDPIGDALELAVDDGFVEFPESELAWVVVQMSTEHETPHPDDLELRRFVEGLINEALGWTGNGHCDGGDIGAGTTNVFALTVDSEAAVRAVAEALEGEGLLERSKIAVRDADTYRVAWPEGSSETLAL